MKKITGKIFNNLSLIYKILAIVATALLILLLFPENQSTTYDFSENGFWQNDDLYAPFDFPIVKTDEEIMREKKTLQNSMLLFFNIDPLARQNTIKGIRGLEIEDRYKKSAISLMTEFYGKGIYEMPADYPTYESRTFILIDGNVGEERRFSEYYSLGDCDSALSEIVPDSQIKSLILGKIVPSLDFDELRTDTEYESQVSQISSTMDIVSKDELIVTKGEHITAEKARILQSLEQEEQRKHQEHFSKFNYNLGKFLLNIIALAVLFFFLKLIKHPLLEDNKKVTFVLFIILLMAAMMAATVRIDSHYTLLVPICLAPILMRVFFDIRVALYIHLVNTIILASWVPNSFEFIYYQIIAGMLSIICVKDVERRSNFFIVSLMIFFSYSAIYVAGVLSQDTSLSGIEPEKFFIFFLNALLTLLAYPLIYLFEKMFGLVTRLTLLEISNTNNKLLRALSDKAPGTFQHSIQVANLSENIIHEIGGNALLAKAGALYHDVGKIENPLCFTENQMGSFNPHDNLSNSESAKLIIGHVAKGIALAKKYKIPEEIADFIRTHHGTTRTAYFYNRQLRDFPNEPIDEYDYQYLGPRPYSRETAVVMLVDSVEAAVKSLKNPRIEDIENLVDNVVDSKIADDQLSNCNITFRDIDKIKMILKKRMISICHPRTEYPVAETGKS